MKILVCVKRVVDANVKARVRSDQTDVETTGVKMSINPFDEIAVEAAVKLKETGVAQEVVVLSCGTAASQETLRTALAMGADRAILVQCDAPLEPLAVAKLIRAVAINERPDAILLGKQAIDDDCNQTGQMLSATLGWSQATNASKIAFSDGKALVTREVDGGLETLEVTVPTVITVDLRLNEPRYVTLPNIMKAKKKPIDITMASALSVDVSPRLSILKMSEPPMRQAGVKVADVQTLVNKLRDEAKVI